MKNLSNFYKNIPLRFLSITLLLLILVIPVLAASSKNNKDTQPPTAPKSLTATSVTQNSVSLKWTASTDNKRVSSYLIYRNSNYLATAYGTTYTATGLAAGTNCSFYIVAKDSSGNLSSSSNVINITTTSSSVTTTTTAPTTTDTTTQQTTTTAPSTTTTKPSTTTTTTQPSTTQPSTNLNKLVIGYYASWAAYSGFTPLNIQASKLTTINYAFANIGSDLKIALGDPNIDVSNFNKLNQLKQTYPNLKTVISVGGWTWSGKFSDVALTESSRTIFADSCVAFIKQYGFNGVDLDWEYPVKGGLSTNTYRPEDKTNFTLLLKKLREKLDAQGVIDGKKYILSFAGGAGSTYTSNVELSNIRNYVDYANVMTYDLHGPWDTYTDFNSPLYNPTETSPQYKVSVDSAIKNWISKGFPASKIVMGVPFYGYKYSGVSNVNNGLYGTFSSSSSISYDSIVASYLSNSSYIKYTHSVAKVPWLFNGSIFITYDDEQSMAAKANYIIQNNLAGATIWELSQNKNGTLLNALYSNLR